MSANPLTGLCRIEYYFKRDELLKLLNAHPHAKGIIVSHEISREKPKGAHEYTNVAHIRARAHKDGAIGDGGGDDQSINGCPYPPGCGDGDGN